MCRFINEAVHIHHATADSALAVAELAVTAGPDPTPRLGVDMNPVCDLARQHGSPQTRSTHPKVGAGLSHKSCREMYYSRTRGWWIPQG